MTSAYSETPLAKKLGIKKGYSLIFHNLPEHYFMLFSDLPEGIEEIEPTEDAADFIHIFCTHLKELEPVFNKLLPTLKKNGSLWISWPKGKSKIPTDLKRDPIRELILKKGLVDVKVAAIDDDWSGLKFMYRKENR